MPTLMRQSNGLTMISCTAVHIVRKKRTALIAREIGCGVVPLSEKDRLWRELHGAALAKAAAKADSVIRLFCGLPERLK